MNKKKGKGLNAIKRALAFTLALLMVFSLTRLDQFRVKADETPTPTTSAGPVYFDVSGTYLVANFVSIEIKDGTDVISAGTVQSPEGFKVILLDGKQIVSGKSYSCRISNLYYNDVEQDISGTDLVNSATKAVKIALDDEDAKLINITGTITTGTENPINIADAMTVSCGEKQVPITNGVYSINVLSGTMATLTFTVKDGYAFDTKGTNSVSDTLIVGDSADKETTENFSFDYYVKTTVKSDQHGTAEFTDANGNEVIANAGETAEGWVKYGSDVTFTTTPNAGYHYAGNITHATITAPYTFNANFECNLTFDSTSISVKPQDWSKTTTISGKLNYVCSPGETTVDLTQNNVTIKCLDSKNKDVIKSYEISKINDNSYEFDISIETDIDDSCTLIAEYNKAQAEYQGLLLKNDITVPQIKSASVNGNINTDGKGWVRNGVSLNVTGTDNLSGVSEYMITTDATAPKEDSNNWQSYTGDTIVYSSDSQNEGPLYLWLKDGAGNISKSSTFKDADGTTTPVKLDNSAPTVNVIISSNSAPSVSNDKQNWKLNADNKTIELTATLTDTEAGFGSSDTFKKSLAVSFVSTKSGSAPITLTPTSVTMNADNTEATVVFNIDPNASTTIGGLGQLTLSAQDNIGNKVASNVKIGGSLDSYFIVESTLPTVELIVDKAPYTFKSSVSGVPVEYWTNDGKTIDFKANAKDTDISSGLKSVIVSPDQNNYSFSISNSDTTTVKDYTTVYQKNIDFSVKKDDFSGNTENISATATDNAGNTATELQDIHFDTTLPGITENSSDRAYSDNNKAYQESASKTWLNANESATYEYTITDAGSGINSVKAWAGCAGSYAEADAGKQLAVTISKATGAVDTPTAETLSDVSHKCTGVTVRVTVNKAQMESDGYAGINLEVNDNVGNTGTYKAEGQSEIWYDNLAPTLSNFQFSSNGLSNLEDSAVHLFKTDDGKYGFFCEHAVTVTFNASDSAITEGDTGSGVAVANYELVPVSGSKVDGVCDGNDGSYSFNIPENFKGQVFVWAADHVQNTCDKQRPNGIVLEDESLHASASSAAITLPETSYHDALGYPLYNSAQTIGLNLQDTHSGLATAQYTYNSYYKGTQTETAKINDNVNADSGEITTTIDNGISGFSFEKEANQGSNLYTSGSGSKTISEDANSITLGLNLTDRVGLGTAAENKTFSIDTVAPVITVTWDNNDVRNGKYYNADRTATVTVKERNFNPDACNFITTGPTPSISGWTHVGGGSCDGSVHTDDCSYVATVTFSQDGDYSFTFNTTDLAGNSAAYSQTDEFTVDKTAPIINVTYSNNDVRNGMYYNASRIGTITITEHNFNSADVQTSITVNGAAAPGVGGWSSSNDENSASIGYTYDGEFTFNVSYTDLAGNPAAPYQGDHFIVDMTKPSIEIYDIVDKSANNGTVAPGVRYSDTNVDTNGVSIKLTGANNGDYKLDGNKSSSGNSVDLKLNDFPHEESVDDLYTMAATVSDLAGNQSEQSVLFSVNRFGSVYVLSDDTKALVQNKYTNVEPTVVVSEINVDSLEERDVSMARDGDVSELKETTDYKVAGSGDENTWKKYDYTIAKSNFTQEGNYTLTLYSKDRATNTQNNKIKKKDIEFVVDKTAPSIVVSGVSDNHQYRASDREVTIDTQDNYALSGVTVTLNGADTTYSREDLDKTGGKITMTVNGSNSWQDIIITSVDAAGNKADSSNIRFLITKNVFVQFISNKPVLYSSTGILAALLLLLFFLFGKRRKQNEDQIQGR